MDPCKRLTLIKSSLHPIETSFKKRKLLFEKVDLSYFHFLEGNMFVLIYMQTFRILSLFRSEHLLQIIGIIHYTRTIFPSEILLTNLQNRNSLNIALKKVGRVYIYFRAVTPRQLLSRLVFFRNRHALFREQLT